MGSWRSKWNEHVAAQKGMNLKLLPVMDPPAQSAPIGFPYDTVEERCRFQAYTPTAIIRLPSSAIDD